MDLKAQRIKAQRIHSLEEIIQFFKNQKFVPTSEKTPAYQLGLFNEAEEIEADRLADAGATDEIVVNAHRRTRSPVQYP